MLIFETNVKKKDLAPAREENDRQLPKQIINPSS